MRLLTFIFLTLLVWTNAQNDYPIWINGTFPDDFKWGLATASYQIEGAWNISGKGPNIWDTFTRRTPSPINDTSDGDVACDSYHKYQVDVQLLKNMGAHYYRFSVSWSRVIPTGSIADGINEEGIDYYNNVIDDLIRNNIEPMITMYHWDLPQGLQDQDGWQNPAIADQFLAYSNLLYSRFGDRVKTWITFNEPWVSCVMGHGDGVHAPGIREPATAPYKCAHNILISHAKAYRLYQNTYKAAQNGLVGITLDCAWYQPKDETNEDHRKASERALLFKHGWYAFPIFKGGDYPPVMREFIDRKSTEDGIASRLPQFTDEEKTLISGSSDFLGFNHYTTDYVEPSESTTRSWYGDQDTRSSKDDDWDLSASDWLRHVPWGFRKFLVWIKETYDNPIVYITESGFSDTPDVGVNDVSRVKYYREYINEMLKAVTIDDCKVKAYTAWSLMDNFEWARGYTERFGVHWVNFTHPDRPRIAKNSAIELKKIFENNGFPHDSTGSTASIKTVVSLITYVFAFVVFMYGRL